MMRIAHIVVDARHLERYRAALKEGIEAALSRESGLLSLFATSAKDDPTRFTILEIYANQAAYEAHLNTPHFLAYKAKTQDLVRSLEVVDVDPLIPGQKIA